MITSGTYVIELTVLLMNLRSSVKVLMCAVSLMLTCPKNAASGIVHEASCRHSIKAADQIDLIGLRGMKTGGIEMVVD